MSREDNAYITIIGLLMTGLVIVHLGYIFSAFVLFMVALYIMIKSRQEE